MPDAPARGQPRGPAFPRATAVPAGAALVALTMVLAGCAGPAGIGPEEPTLRASTAAAEWTPAAFVDAEPLDEIIWFNGSFLPHQARWPRTLVWGAAGLPNDSLRVLDLSGQVPAGVPIRLEADLRAQMEQGDLDVWVETGAGEFWTFDGQTPRGGTNQIDVGLVRRGDAPLRLVVQYDEPEPSATIPFSVRVRITAQPDRIMAGIPVAVDLMAGSVLNLTWLPARRDPDAARALLVYAPDHTLLARLHDEAAQAYELPPDAVPGRYVLVTAEGSGDALLAVAGPGAASLPLTALQGRVELGDPHVGNDREVRWSFDLAHVPLRVGFMARGPHAALDAQATLDAPGGRVVEFAAVGGPWILPGFGFGTDVADERLGRGSYLAHLAFGQAAGAPVVGQAFHVTYER
jgi:hypothetical protein